MVRPERLIRAGDLVPNLAKLFPLLGIGVHGGAEGLFFIALTAHELRIAQTGEKSGVGFVAVLSGEHKLAGDALIFRVLGAVGLKSFDHRAEAIVEKGIGYIAAVLELCDCQEPSGSSGIAADERQFTILDACLAPA